MLRNRSSRRDFLRRTAALVAAPMAVPAHVIGRGAGPAPSNQITMALIGLGSMGLRHVKGFLEEEDCRILAVCDVDARRHKPALDEVNARYGNHDCVAYGDFREVLARDDIDTVCIAVPDHWHSVVSIRAIRARKDIYGEKPLALTIREGQDMVREVNRHQCVWQTGSWQRSTAHFRFGCELVRNGRIGRLQRVEVVIGTGPVIGPQPVMPVPEGFDYDMWLGPAPWAPYTEKRCHWDFRWILDYSGGQVTDWGAHHIDIAQWGMGTDHTGPVSVEGTGVFPSEGLWNAATEYHFTCEYANGVALDVQSHPKDAYVRFVGEDGWVSISRARATASPESLMRERFGPEEIHLARPRGDERQGHRRDFLDCVRTRAACITPIEVGHRSATICHLGNIAMLMGRKIRWDPDREAILDDDSAARMCGGAMRSPWRY